MEPEEVLEQEPVVEEPTAQKEPEVLNITTRGKWVLVESLLPTPMENGKTYKIKVAGHCQFMIAETEPTAGMVTNEITYTKDDNNKLWIKTGL